MSKRNRAAARRSRFARGESEAGRYIYSSLSLRFLEEGVESEYLTYRRPRTLEILRWVLGIGAAVVFLGLLIDFTTLGGVAAWELLAIRAAASIGALTALALTFTPWAQRNLFEFIAGGAVAIHMIWLAATPIIGDLITAYTGLLPINLMLTFLVSGLMFRWAIWVAAAAAVAYTIALYSFHPSPLAPSFYMVIAGVYAGYAAFMAERARRDYWADEQLLDAEKAKSDALLLNVLPPSIADRMRGGEQLIADRFEDASVLFADICGFTKMSASMKPEELVNILDEIFRRFDRIAVEHDLEKIKTMGDCYMMACGLPRERRKDHARLAQAALDMEAALAEIAAELNADLQIRVGIHSGPVVAGVIGEAKFIYDLWGDTVNTASRMESTALPGSIQISEAMRERIGDDFLVAERGLVEMKGKGEQMTYTLREPANRAAV
ncbi:MAG: adenylate/guanylate cyclase domain-containing protein [Pseudomonadota bacterium]